MKLHRIFLLAGATALLAACGDNPADAPEAPAPAGNEVPASATASPTAYALYAGSLVPSETQAPLDVGPVTPPVTETEAPLAF